MNKLTYCLAVLACGLSILACSMGPAAPAALATATAADAYPNFGPQRSAARLCRAAFLHGRLQTTPGGQHLPGISRQVHLVYFAVRG